MGKMLILIVIYIFSVVFDGNWGTWGGTQSCGGTAISFAIQVEPRKKIF
jgi:hypothetical protein